MARFKKIILIVAISLGSLFVLLLGAVYVFSGEIKKAVIEQVNQQLATRVKVGEVYFSVFENFPQASVTFKEVSFAESYLVHGSPLASFEKISVTLNFWDAVRKKIRIHSIRLINGSVLAATNSKGKENFQVLKKSSDTTASGSVDFSFQMLKLENVYLGFADSLAKIYTELDVEKIACSGSFKEEKYAMSLDGRFKMSLQTGERNWIHERNVEMNTGITVDNASGKFIFDNTRLRLEELLFQLDGYWKIKGEQAGKINISTPGLEIQHLISLLPAEWGNSASEYKSSGELLLNASVEKKEKLSDMLVNASFSVNNGSLYIAEFGEGVKDIQLKGDLVLNGKKQELVLEKAEARLMNDFFRIKGKVVDFNDPYLDLFMLGEINLANVKRVVNLGKYGQSTGLVKMDFSLKGKLSHLEDPAKMQQVTLNGKLEGNKLQIGDSTLENRLRDMDISVSLDRLRTTIHYLNATWNENTFAISGEADNLLAYLFNKETVLISGKLKADRLTFDTPKDKAKSEKTSDSSSFDLPPRVALSANVEVGSLKVDKFIASDIRGTVELNENVMEVQGLRFATCKGNISLKGRWQKKDNGDNHVVVSSSIQKVDINEFFKEFNNFGQQELTDKNLKGQLTGDLDMAFLTDKFFELKSKSLYSFIKLKIENGELNNYEPVKALSRFVKLKELESIRFQTLSNEIEIQDEQIYIPLMEIKNSALNFFLEGKHSFSNIIDYSVRMQLKDLLAGSYASHHEPDEFEKEEQGINLFIRMQGPVDNISFKYDRKQARKNFKEDMKTEKQNVKELLRKEFGIQKKDTNAQKKPGNTQSWEDDIPD